MMWFWGRDSSRGETKSSTIGTNGDKFPTVKTREKIAAKKYNNIIVSIPRL